MMKAIIGIILGALLLLANACKQELPNWSGVVTFSVAGPQTVIADGYDTLKLTAHINPNSDPDKRVVTFSTDYGTFSNGQNSIVINADQNGNASTGLKGTIVATATVRATVQTTFSILKTVYFVAPATSLIFTVSPFNSTITADGVSTMAISATFNKALQTTPQTMVFTTDLGMFTNGTATITVPADTSGKVTAYLKSSVAAGVHITLTSNNVTQVLTGNFVAGTAATIFTLNPVSGPVPADGVTTVAIGAVVNKNLLVSPQNVVFSTDLGTFGNGTTTITQAADPNGNAVVYLKNTIPGKAHVSVSNTSLTQVTTATFLKALPDTILLSAAPTLTSGYANSLNVGIALKRKIGTVSPNFLLSYSATDSSGNPIGTFSNGTASDQNGNASVTFTMGNSDYTGTVTITVALQQNTAIRSTVNVLIN